MSFEKSDRRFKPWQRRRSIVLLLSLLLPILLLLVLISLLNCYLFCSSAHISQFIFNSPLCRLTRMSTSSNANAQIAPPSQSTILKTSNFVIEVDLNLNSKPAGNQASTARLIHSKPILASNSSSLFQIRIRHSRDVSRILWQSIHQLFT